MQRLLQTKGGTMNFYQPPPMPPAMTQEPTPTETRTEMETPPIRRGRPAKGSEEAKEQMRRVRQAQISRAQAEGR